VAVGTDPREQAAATDGELVEQARAHVDRAQRLLAQSQQAVQHAEARVLRTQRRVQGTYRRAEDVAGAAERIHQATAAAVDRLIKIKRHELAAHRTAAALHEQAAHLQGRLGHPDRAAAARAHAEHARELYRRAGEELADYLARTTIATDQASSTPRRSS
jgi:hypothetical protein